MLGPSRSSSKTFLKNFRSWKLVRGSSTIQYIYLVKSFSDLTPVLVDSFYEILNSCEFDRNLAIEQVRQSFQHPKSFELPSRLISNGYKPALSLRLSAKRSRGGRLLTPPRSPEEASSSNTENCIEVHTS